MQSYRSFILLTLFLVSSLFAQDGWFWQYPKPQGNTLHDIYVFDSNTAIAVGDLGTVVKTTDGGESWKVQHHIQGVSQNLYDLYFLNALRGWAVGGLSGSPPHHGVLLMTEDGGENWTILKTDSLHSFGSVYFVNPDTGWVFGTEGLVMRTLDGGETWTTIFIYTFDDAPDFGAATFIDEQTGWLVGSGFYGNTIHKTTDGGNSWIQLINVNPIVYGSTDVYFIDENTGWVVGLFGHIIKTTDGGATWTHQRAKENDVYYSVHFADADTGWVVGGDTGGSSGSVIILKTTDGGETWDEQSIDASGYLFSSDFNDGFGWTVGTDGLIYRTIDRGENWISQRDEKYNFNSVHFANESEGWAVGEKGVILHSEDGGKNWYKQNHNDSLSFSSVYAIDNQNVFTVGSVIKGLSIYDRNGIIFRTTDSGQIWAKQTFNSLLGFNFITFVNDSTGWITVTNGTLLKTTNRGNTWEQFSSDLGTVLNTIQFVNESTGWISFYSGNTLLKTTDGGNNWNSQFIDSNFNMYSFYFINANMGWAVGEYHFGKNIYKTTDGGISWSPL